jgi:uncharacterized protein with ParB-like and HNH nuclease domain
MAKINAEIKKIAELLNQKLEIPHYQRPYRWTDSNVNLLLNDILLSWKQGKKSYRIGSVILNEDSKSSSFHIVDGQQRITTILLLFKALETGLFNDLLENLNYNHSDSVNAIKNNFKTIQIWVNENIYNEKKEYITYITKHCEIVEIKVEDLSEAFQMFDTQNGRGKELQAYNLLKAFHIRAMEVNSFDEKIECDKNWENATRFLSPSNHEIDLLNHLFTEQIYRTRIWSRKNTPGRFNKTKINEFKGFTVDKYQSISFPYQNNALMLHIIQKYMDTMGTQVKGIQSRFKHLQIESVSPFATINQDFINGKNFFDYVLTYTEIYKHLFEYDHPHVLPDFKLFYKNYCIDYAGSKRDGDQYLLELYKSLIFLVFDKFGEDGVNRMYKILYALVYRLRLEKIQVKYASVDEFPVESQVFYIIQEAKQYSDLQVLQKKAYHKVNCRKEVNQILTFFFNEGIEVFTEDKEIDLEKYKSNNAN